MLLFLIPIGMIVWGLWWRKKPPKYPRNPDIGGWNFFIGYRTEWSLKSPDTWYYAHISYGRLILPIGIIALMITLLGVVFLPPQYMAQVLLIVDLIGIMAPYYPIEKKMKKLFDKKGKWKEE
ncbi:MAG: SdpI family protein [Negativibacillus sp.]|nr:SdpI family protein [Negativibacillus sp.]